jgi:hypothetical protein
MSIIEFRRHSIETEIAVKKTANEDFLFELGHVSRCTLFMHVARLSGQLNIRIVHASYVGSSPHPTQLGWLSQRTLCVRSLAYLRMC